MAMFCFPPLPLVSSPCHLLRRPADTMKQQHYISRPANRIRFNEPVPLRRLNDKQRPDTCWISNPHSGSVKVTQLGDNRGTELSVSSSSFGVNISVFWNRCKSLQFVATLQTLPQCIQHTCPLFPLLDKLVSDVWPAYGGTSWDLQFKRTSLSRDKTLMEVPGSHVGSAVLTVLCGSLQFLYTKPQIRSWPLHCQSRAMRASFGLIRLGCVRLG